MGVKCLHAHYAWHLAGGDDPVGRWIDQHLDDRPLTSLSHRVGTMGRMPTHDQKTAGRELRYRLTLVLLDHRRPMTLADLLVALDQSGYDVAGRPSKTVSDALRWEVRRGRVRRLARSTYRTGSAPQVRVRASV